MNDQQTSTVWLGAFRYYLGRQTYAVSDFCELLIQEWSALPRYTQDLIRKELAKEIERDSEAREQNLSFYPLGQDCDRAEWLRVQHIIQRL